MTRANMHASAVLVGDRCVIVAGPSGSGKSAICLALVDHCRWWGIFGRLVADDQILLSAVAGRLVVRAPSAIGGLAEVRGAGPVAIPHEGGAVADLIVRLVDPANAPRLPDPRTETLKGIDLPAIDLAAREIGGAVSAIAGLLYLPPFTRKTTGR